MIELTDRMLRFDGVSEIKPDHLVRFLLLGVPPSKLRVTELTPEIRRFNEQVSTKDELKLVNDEPVNLDFSWRVPEPFLSLDLRRHVSLLYINRAKELGYTPELTEAGSARIEIEMLEIEERSMIEFMRAVIYVLHELKRNDVVWGVGRGSSCASYVLFILGLHVVDCVKLNVPMQEFFH